MKHLIFISLLFFSSFSFAQSIISFRLSDFTSAHSFESNSLLSGSEEYNHEVRNGVSGDLICDLFWKDSVKFHRFVIGGGSIRYLHTYTYTVNSLVERSIMRDYRNSHFSIRYGIGKRFSFSRFNLLGVTELFYNYIDIPVSVTQSDEYQNGIVQLGERIYYRLPSTNQIGFCLNVGFGYSFGKHLMIGLESGQSFYYSKRIGNSLTEQEVYDSKHNLISSNSRTGFVLSSGYYSSWNRILVSVSYKIL